MSQVSSTPTKKLRVRFTSPAWRRCSYDGSHQHQEGAVITAELELRRYRTEAGSLRQNISKASSTVAAMRKKATAASAAASRSSGPFNVRMKRSEAERATKQANEAEAKRAGLEQELANVETKLLKAQDKWERERQTAQDRALRELASRTTQAASQSESSQLPSARRAVETTPSTDSAATPKGGGAPAPAPAPAPARDIFLSHASEDKDEIARR
jgi:chromosome segregation ATPase